MHLPLTPFQVQEKMMLQVSGVDSKPGGRGDPRKPSHCLLLICGKFTARATDLMGRLREPHVSRRGYGRYLTLRASL